MTRLPGCGTWTAARMWYLEPSCMLLVACMTVEWPLSALCHLCPVMPRSTGFSPKRSAVALLNSGGWSGGFVALNSAEG